MSAGRGGEQPGLTRADGSDKHGVNIFLHLVFFAKFQLQFRASKI